MVTFFPEIKLQPGETIRQRWPANRTQSRWRAAGGMLFLTTHRLAFEPNVLDALLGGQRSCLGLKEISRVSTQPPQRGVEHLFNGGLRSRLQVETASGGRECFVVDRLPEVHQSLQEAIATAAA